ncbi:T9SS type A sorting domain-containing protein [bacterium]|nr:T9SS type A sorting domain-containing protein [bacterium]
MKKFIAVVLACTVMTTVAFAANFSPTLLKLSAAQTVKYDFDGSKLDIPIQISGRPANLIFLVFSKGQAESIKPVRNGHLGWHYVNKIDTCIFVSQPKIMDVGSNIVSWDGKNTDGKAVPRSEYTYYMWAYDNLTSKIAVSRSLSFKRPNAIIVTMDEKNNPLSNPLIVTGGTSHKGNDTRDKRTHYKWMIGGDPDDAALMETTAVMAFGDKGTIAFLPSDHDYWFKSSQRPSGVVEIGKYKWVPNGDSEIQTAWGDNGYFTYAEPVFCTEYHNDLVIIEGHNDILSVNSVFNAANVSELVYCDMTDGTETTRVDMSDWWVRVDDGEAGAQSCGGPLYFGLGPNGMLAMGAHTNCMNQAIDPYRNGEAGGEINDLTLWVNQNGDYVGDHNFNEDANLPWVCFDYNVAPYKYNITLDANGFSIFPSYDLGAVSFGLFAPDGTGIGYFAYAGETAALKYGNHYVDYNSPYDGIYTDNNSSETDKSGFFYVGHDSIKGIITSQVAVEEAVPAAFTVAQNVPNPFNPSTTINFNTAQAGNVTIDVFNIAGQQVATIADKFMSAGSHSVTWDASGVSAGVYFYTVRSGQFSKTMKMTLLK